MRPPPHSLRRVPPFAKHGGAPPHCPIAHNDAAPRQLVVPTYNVVFFGLPQEYAQSRLSHTHGHRKLRAHHHLVITAIRAVHAFTITQFYHLRINYVSSRPSFPFPRVIALLRIYSVARDSALCSTALHLAHLRLASPQMRLCSHPDAYVLPHPASIPRRSPTRSLHHLC